MEDSALTSRAACVDLDLPTGEAVLVEAEVVALMERTPVSLRDEKYDKGYRDALALCIDLRGFSTWSRDAEPPTVASFLERYSQELLAGVNWFAVSYYKLLGDGALVIWDVASPGAVDAARELFRLLREVVEEVSSSYGSTCALAGALTVDSLYKYEIFGECSGLKYRDYLGYGINSAFRLQSMAAPGELLTSPALALRFVPGLPRLPSERKPLRTSLKGPKDEDYDGVSILEAFPHA